MSLSLPWPAALPYCSRAHLLRACVMSLRGLNRFGFALWIGLLALMASGFAQNQLSSNVLLASLNPDATSSVGGHYMPDGTFMAGPMAGAHTAPAQDGHTHKGHADCALCSVVAAMAALAVPVLDTVVAPDVFAAPTSWSAVSLRFTDASYVPYASRAPPHLIG